MGPETVWLLIFFTDHYFKHLTKNQRKPTTSGLWNRKC